MLDPADLPPDDILDYVAIDTDNAGQLRIRVVEGKKHLRAVQEYLTRLRARYQGRVGDFEFTTLDVIARIREATTIAGLNRPGFPGECFICELRLPDHRFRWKHNKLFLLLPEEYGPAFPAIVDCYTSPPTLVWPVPLLHGFSSSYGVLPPLCKDH